MITAETFPGIHPCMYPYMDGCRAGLGLVLVAYTTQEVDPGSM